MGYGEIAGGCLAVMAELWPALLIPDDVLEGGFAAEGAIALTLHVEGSGA